MLYALSMIITLAWPGAGARDDAVDALRKDDTIQQVLPEVTADARRGARPEPARSSSGVHIHRSTSSIAAVLMWVIVGAIVLALIAVIVREVAGRPADARAPPADDAAAEPVAPLQVAAGTLDDAERMAQQGRFADAIHTLLLRTFDTIGRQAALPPALTSREVLQRVRAEGEAVRALAHLVNSVEASFFGTAQPGVEEYRLCRASFERVLNARGVEVT